MMNILEAVELSEWKTKKIILKELKNNGISMSGRKWRKFVENYNKQFINEDSEYFIAHSSKGYKLTNELEEIISSAKELKKRAVDMEEKCSGIMEAVEKRMNMKMEF